MTPVDPRLDQIGHIIRLIKSYRQLKTTSDAAYPRSLERYLRQHLSIGEYILWRSLHMPPDTDGLPETVTHFT